ncbi:hypothetical protein B0H11DRAFT_1928026 [Mycena galericulata]|nr:hypothetical protein B0H11DRAFT_1928026 [Mycena galericulata]
MSVPLSLFDELTQQNQLTFPTITETQLLQTVGHDPAASGESQNRFDEYGGMIVYSEKLLYDFSLVAEKESIAPKLPANDKIQNDLEFMRDNEASPIQNRLNTIKAALAKSPENLPDDVVVYSTQTARAIEIITRSRDSQIADRMRSAELWGKPKGSESLTIWTRLVTLVERHAIDATLPPANLGQAWADFLAYLTAGVVVELPGTYNVLRRVVTQIGRPRKHLRCSLRFKYPRPRPPTPTMTATNDEQGVGGHGVGDFPKNIFFKNPAPDPAPDTDGNGDER